MVEYFEVRRVGAEQAGVVEKVASAWRLLKGLFDFFVFSILSRVNLTKLVYSNDV